LAVRPAQEAGSEADSAAEAAAGSAETAAVVVAASVGADSVAVDEAAGAAAGSAAVDEAAEAAAGSAAVDEAVGSAMEAWEASVVDSAVAATAVAEVEVVPKAPQPSSTSAGGSCRLRQGHTGPKRCSKPQVL
jgi:hypothetical protein